MGVTHPQWAVAPSLGDAPVDDLALAGAVETRQAGANRVSSLVEN
jgi:hypothetical protein